MPLQRQVVTIPLAAGRQDKLDPKIVQPGGSLAARNVYQQRTGELRRRDGYTQLTNDSIELFEINESTSIRQIRSGPMLEARTEPGVASNTDPQSGPGYFSRLSGADTWRDIGRYSNVRVSAKHIARGGAYNSKFATGGGVTVHASLSKDAATSALALVVVDAFDSTGAMLREKMPAFSSSGVDASFFGVVWTGTLFVFIAKDVTTQDIESYSWNPNTPYTDPVSLGSTIALTAAEKDADIVTVGSSHFILYENGAADIEARAITASGFGSLLSTINTTNGVKLHTLGASAISDLAATTDRISVVWVDSTSGNLECAILNAAATSVLFGPTVLDSSTTFGAGLSATTAANDHKYNTPASAECHRVLISHDTADGADTETYLVDFDGTLITGAQFDPFTMTSCRVVSKAFSLNRSAYCLFGNQDDDNTIQQTLFLKSVYNGTEVDEPMPVVEAKAGLDLASTRLMSANPGLPIADVSVSGTTIKTTHVMLTAISGLSTEVDTEIVELTFDFSGSRKAQSVDVRGGVLLGGGTMRWVDDVVMEAGFHTYPLIRQTTPTLGGNLDPSASYSYIATYEWVDRLGNLHRSAPSIAKALTTDASNRSADVVITTLKETDWRNKQVIGPVDFNTVIQVALYRTEGGGSVYYLAGTTSNDPRVDEVTISDDLADTTLLNQRILYTEGGELESQQTPASYIMKLMGDHVFAVQDDDRTSLWVSKPLAAGIAPEFNAALNLRLSEGGDITGLAVMDGKLIVFKDRSVFYLFGQGPSAVGTGGFSGPVKVPASVGCTEHESIAETQHGVFFKSNKGIYLLDRSLQVSYVGAPVESYNSQSILAANVIERLNQVRFLTSGGTDTLVYDYHHNQWTVFVTGSGADSHAAVIDGEYTKCLTDGFTWIESSSQQRDDVNDYTILVDTPWIKTSGIEGFQRIYWAHLIGENLQAHEIIVGVYYNYVETEVESITVDATNLNSPYQFRIKPARQKCESIRFRITDNPLVTNGNTMRLTAIELDVGMKPSRFKVGSSRTFGA